MNEYFLCYIRNPVFSFKIPGPARVLLPILPTLLQYFPFLFYYDLFSLYLYLGIENAEHFCVNKKQKWQGEQSTQNMERCESIMMIRTTVRVQIITDF